MEKFRVEMLSKETISATMSRAPKEGRAVKRGLNGSYRVFNVIQLEILTIMSQYNVFQHRRSFTTTHYIYELRQIANYFGAFLQCNLCSF